jgi:hypothetical protein
MGAGAECDVRDGVPGARNFRESTFLDQDLERNGEGGETVRRSGVGSAPIRVAAAQRSTLGIFAKQLWLLAVCRPLASIPPADRPVDVTAETAA